MKKSDKSQAFPKTLALAATLAALGASVGVPVEQGLAASPEGKYGAVQDKTVPLRGARATQSKIEANQYKERRAGRRAAGTPGSSTKLNPQPEPPKPAIGAPGALVPAVKQ